MHKLFKLSTLYRVPSFHLTVEWKNIIINYFPYFRTGGGEGGLDVLATFGGSLLSGI